MRRTIWIIVVILLIVFAAGLTVYVIVRDNNSAKSPANTTVPASGATAVPVVDKSDGQYCTGTTGGVSYKIPYGNSQVVNDTNVECDSNGNTVFNSLSAPSADWPTTAEEAAKLFGGTADRWKLTPDGGWQLREETFRTSINPSGFTAEGYYDQKPGKDPYQAVFTTPLEVQGCTVWPLPPARANELFDEMAKQKGYTIEQADQLINKLGWE